MSCSKFDLAGNAAGNVTCHFAALRQRVQPVLARNDCCSEYRSIARGLSLQWRPTWTIKARARNEKASDELRSTHQGYGVFVHRRGMYYCLGPTDSSSFDD
jgi:hypothetical protein